MNLGKLSGIKGLVSNSHGKRRFKGDLSADMISPPLGDFRHTMHVGRGGDVFGDTSFLSNHGGAGGGVPDSSPEKAYGFFSRTLRHVRRTPARPEGGTPQALSPPPPPVSPIIKNAISLPRLDVDTPNGCVKRELFPSSPSCPESSTLSYGVESGFATLPRLSRTERQQQDSPEPCSPPPHRSSLSEDDVRAPTRSDSMTSFTVDLGPSLMSEVLGMIDGPDCSLKASLVSQEEGLPATDDPQSKLAHSPFREGLNGGESLGRDWEKQENARPLTKATPEVATISSSRVESVMEAESFQRAADVIARHYGGNGTLRGQRKIECGNQQHFRPGPDPNRHTQKRAPYPYTEEEEEIKV